MKTRTALVAVVTAVGAIVVPTAIASTSVRGCAKPAAGGEWRSYGHDLANTRHQPAEHSITAANAGDLTPKWMFSNEGNGSFQGTPVVADGCVFVGDEGGFVYALNADSGQVVWKAPVFSPVQSTPTVTGGRVYVSVSLHEAPYLVALDERTGKLLWKRQMVHQFGTEALSSPAVHDGLVIAGVSGASAEAGTTVCPGFAADSFGCGGGADSRLKFRGIYVIVDADTGKLLKRGYAIPDKDFKAGYAGGGIWSTAAIDKKTDYAYFGTGNPFSAREHDNTNAIIKVDVRRGRSTFGKVVDSYHGTNDLYVDGSIGKDKPVCEVYVDVFTCDPPDFDFGASPQLMTLGGKRYVGDMQKSGVYHLANAKNMKGKWHQIVGGPFGQVGQMGTASYDGKHILTGGSAPGLASSLNPKTGAREWVAPIADGVHFQSMSSAGGVLYGVDSRGILDGWDIATGRQILVRPLGVDTGETTYSAFSSGPSVSIARHTVYVAASGYVIAYRP